MSIEENGNGVMTATHKDIAKTTGLIGLSQVFVIIFAVIKTKVIALIVGAKGVGDLGLYKNYADIVSQVSALGLNASGVREIAKNDVPNAKTDVYKTITILKYCLIAFSIFGVAFMIVFAKKASLEIFKSKAHIWGIIIAAFYVLFTNLGHCQKAILNGIQRIKDLVKSQVLGAIAGCISSAAVVLLLKIDGIPFVLLFTALSEFLVIWWFVKKAHIRTPSISAIEKAELIFTTKSLLRMGVSLSLSGIISQIFALLIKVFIVNKYSKEVLGIYHACWTISNVYIGILVNAMAVDFLPRLMKVVDDTKKLSEYVNRQIEFGLVVTQSALLGLFIFAPLLLNIFYTREFMLGVPIIRYQLLGVVLRVVGFPMMYVFSSSGKEYLFIIVQAILVIVDYVLIVVFANLFGVEALGLNYFLSYTILILNYYLLMRRHYSFTLSPLMKKLFLAMTTSFCILILLSMSKSESNLYLFGSVVVLLNAGLMMNYSKKYMNMNIISQIKKRLSKG